MNAFEQFRVNVADPLLVPSSVYAGSNEALQAIFKALLTKRDTTTRVKNLEGKPLCKLRTAGAGTDDATHTHAELAALAPSIPEADVRDSLAHFAFLLSRLAHDHDRRVRSCTLAAFAAVAKRVPKAVKRRFELFASDVLVAAHDSACDRVAAEAMAAADVDPRMALPAATQLQLWAMVRRRVEDDADFATQKELAIDRVVRLRAAALQVVAACMALTPDLTIPDASVYKLLTSTESTGVRRGAYRLVAAATQHRADLLTPGLLKAAVRIPTEPDRAAMADAWDALLSVARLGDFWPKDARKAFFPELWRMFARHPDALDGALPLLSLVPAAVWDDYAELGGEWLDRLQPPVSVRAWAECMAWMLANGKPGAAARRQSLFSVLPRDAALSAAEARALCRVLPSDDADFFATVPPALVDKLLACESAPPGLWTLAVSLLESAIAGRDAATATRLLDAAATRLPARAHGASWAAFALDRRADVAVLARLLRVDSSATDRAFASCEDAFALACALADAGARVPPSDEAARRVALLPAPSMEAEKAVLACLPQPARLARVFAAVDDAACLVEAQCAVEPGWLPHGPATGVGVFPLLAAAAASPTAAAPTATTGLPPAGAALLRVLAAWRLVPSAAAPHAFEADVVASYLRHVRGIQGLDAVAELCTSAVPGLLSSAMDAAVLAGLVQRLGASAVARLLDAHDELAGAPAKLLVSVLARCHAPLPRVTGEPVDVLECALALALHAEPTTAARNVLASVELPPALAAEACVALLRARRLVDVAVGVLLPRAQAAGPDAAAAVNAARRACFDELQAQALHRLSAENVLDSRLVRELACVVASDFAVDARLFGGLELPTRDEDARALLRLGRGRHESVGLVQIALARRRLVREACDCLAGVPAPLPASVGALLLPLLCGASALRDPAELRAVSGAMQRSDVDAALAGAAQSDAVAAMARRGCDARVASALFSVLARWPRLEDWTEGGDAGALLRAWLDALPLVASGSGHGNDGDAVGSLVWLVLLVHLRAQWKRYPSARPALASLLAEPVAAALTRALAHLDMDVAPRDDAVEGVRVAAAAGLIDEEGAWDVHALAAQVMLESARALPTHTRAWWGELGRADKDGVARYVERHVAPRVLAAAVSELQAQGDAVANAGLSMSASLVARCVRVGCTRDETPLLLDIRFAADQPLSPPVVEFASKVPDKWQRWAVSIATLLARKDGSLLDALLLWKQNLDREFAGVEPCPVCYAVLQAADNSPPNLACGTCRAVFHRKCLATWWASSHHSLCPLCRQSFMAQS